MSTTDKDALLERAAARVADRPNDTLVFIATAMLKWCGGRLDFDRLASHFGCDRRTVARVALCRMPRNGAEIDRVAEACHVDRAKLEKLLRGAS